MQEQNAMMKEMLEMQRGVYKKEAKKEKEGKGNTYEDVVTASGAPNLKAYGKAIWTNFKDVIDEQTGGIGSMLNEDMLKALAANPLGGIAEFVVAGLMVIMITSVHCLMNSECLWDLLSPSPRTRPSVYRK